MIATALNQGRYIGWFNPVGTIRIESKKPIGFILSVIDIEFTKPILPVIHKFSVLRHASSLPSLLFL